MFLPHIIGELCALAAGLDAAAIIRRLCRLLGARGVRSAGDSLALAVLESAGIPADAGLQVAQAGRPQAAHLVAARRERVRELLGGRLQAGDRGAWQLRPGLEVHIPDVGGVHGLRAEALQMAGDGQGAVQLHPAAHGEGLPALVLLGSANGVRILLAQLGHCRRGDEVALVELGGEAHDLVLALAALLLAEHQGLEDLNLIAKVDDLGDERSVRLLKLQRYQVLANVGGNTLLDHLATLILNVDEQLGVGGVTAHQQVAEQEPQEGATVLEKVIAADDATAASGTRMRFLGSNRVQVRHSPADVRLANSLGGIRDALVRMLRFQDHFDTTLTMNCK